MHVAPKIAVLLVLYSCDVCLSIRVPVEWNSDDSVVQVDQNEDLAEGSSTETFKSQNVNIPIQKPISEEYFQYTAKKPQFAVDIAAFHGVKNPQEHYTAYPVRPYTGKQKPNLGKHQIFDHNRPVYKEFQKYVLNDNKPKQVSSVSSNYEVFHPYKDEEPALQELYKDPILDKIRNDIRENKNRLQKYETDTGKADISKDEYLESLDQTDRKNGRQKNNPATYEIHKPLRKPVYYQANPHLYQRDHYLNRRFRNPWNHHSKVRPVNYYPLKHHLQNLRQHHAIKYDDEHNEYPQLPLPQRFAEPSDGYDIYEKGREKYKNLRDQLDESINESVKKNKPTTYNKLELQNQGNKGANASDDEEEEEEEHFVPIKNYAQVRKSETFKHLPQEAAFDDADNLDEIKNAPRLKEAVKSTKAQTVYTEEGYEDTAYDHAGEQKHAGDHEAHGGFLREKELSGGNYKTPSISANHDNGSSLSYRNQLKDGKQWKDSKNDHENENHEDDFTEVEQEDSTNEDAEDQLTPEQLDIEENRIKRANINASNDNEESSNDHDVSKREVNFKVPEIDLNTTFLSEKELLNLSKIKIKTKERENLIQKYPYYFQGIKNIHRDSPLRYAEDLKFIPLKSKSETAFYDSKSKLQCPEVDETVDPIPENLKNGERPESDEEDDSEKNTEVSKKEPRLKGLGDKIDCFKAKYFGVNPLDSPFFKEQLVDNPEPLTVPNAIFKLISFGKHTKAENIKKLKKEFQKKNDEDLLSLLNKLNSRSNKSSDLLSYKQTFNGTKYEGDLLRNMNLTKESSTNKNISEFLRRKRDTAFVYEPYKILEETKKKDQRKQSILRRSIDSRKYSPEKEQPVKRNVGVRSYINIGKNDRINNSTKNFDNIKEITFVNVDKRRGEPRYEVRVNNHKSRYTPVNDKKSISIEDYKRTISNLPREVEEKTQNSSTQFIPEVRSNLEIHKTSSSNTIKSIVAPVTTNSRTNLTTSHIRKDNVNPIDENSNEEYDDYEDEEEEDEEVLTTTTPKPAIRKKSSRTTSTTTPYPVNNEEIEEKPKLKLITRFKNTIKQEKVNDTPKEKNKNKVPINSMSKNANIPKFIEKKKKSSQSTLVSDTNSYADNDDDMRKEEVDALIGVKEDMDEYMPLYEKEIENSPKKSQADGQVTNDYDEDEDDSSSEEEDYESSEEIDSEEEENITTPKTTEKSLAITSDLPEHAAKIQSKNIVQKPIVVKKTIEIHKELPFNKSSPHVTQFKQDFKEVEIIKKMPMRRKPQKNVEALELYKDQNLAKDINKLKAVEVFKENLDISSGPKHGGNYRSARIKLPVNSTWSRKEEPITLQSKNKKQVKYQDDVESSEILGSDKDGTFNKNSEHFESEDDIEVNQPRKNYGNLNSRKALKSRRRKNEAAKLVELQEQEEEDENYTPERNFKTTLVDSKRLHGGNYRSAKLVNLARKNGPPKDAKENSATVLNSFAQAVQILTTTPAYILDPSKRRYYYVDT